MAKPDPYAQFAKPVSAGPTLKEEATSASIGSSNASAASSAASAKRTAALTGPQVRKETALALKAELDAEKLQLAMEKARLQTSGRPLPENLADAQRAVMDELKAAVEAKKLSREMFSASGLGYSTLSNLSGTPAASVTSLLKPIQANMAFSKLQDMRTKSPTGAALGAVSDRELNLLSNSEAPIDPSAGDEVFQQGLDTVIGNRIQMLTRLGADPYEVAALIPEEDRPLYKDRFTAYRFVPDDVKKISSYVDTSRKNGTFDPTDYAALVSEAYYNATGRQPDEQFVKSAAQTGQQLANNPKSALANFDYTPADVEVQKNVIGAGLGGPKDERSLGTALGQGALNLIPSTFELAADTVKALTVNLPETIEGVAKVVGGATGLSDPEAYDALKQYYADRYTDYEGFKKALATDPASILADIAGLATGGATIVAKGLSTAGKVGKIAALADAAKAAEGFGQFAATFDPLAMAGSMGKKGLDLGARTAEAAAVDLPARLAGVTGTDVKQAFNAGTRGSQEFRDQLTGTGDVMDPLAKAEAGLTELFQDRSNRYQQRMAKMDKTEGLEFADVEKAIEGVRKVGRHKGIDISGAGKVWDQIDAKYMEFLDKGLNTIEDFDAMKRAIKEIGSAYQIGTPEYRVANQVAKSINETIVQKAPVYANIMKDYRLASDTLADIKASTSIDAKSADTTLNKLQRAAAGKGPRGRTVLDMLEATSSGKGLGDMLAGQNLRSTEATGFAPTLATPAAMAAGDASPLATLLVTPRGLGEKAYDLGKKYGVVERGAQAVRETAPVQRASELADKYFPAARTAVRVANPVIQAQVDPFVAPSSEGMSADAMMELRKRYGTGLPAPVLRGGGTPTLADLVNAYQNPTGVSLSTVGLPEEEEDAAEYARGGMVAAPLLGMTRR